jgi:type VI secretion system protein ImpM
MTLKAVCGFYGKLPMQSDLVSGNLPADFITPWQQWLQNALAVSREDLGLAWLNSYLTTPIWRFILSAGLCGDNAWAGILMPSIDKQGNYFPLTVVAPFEQSQSLPYLFTLGNHWFEELETVALSGLEDDIDLPRFVQLLQAIPIFPLADSVHSDNHSQFHDCAGKKSAHVTLTNLSLVSDAFVELNACLLDSLLSGYSLWGTSGSEHVQSTLSVYEGLPPAYRFSAFLNSATANRQENHWQSWSATDTGNRRKYNEDSLLNKPETGLWAVADGMGGHKAGDVASQLIVNSLNTLSLSVSLEARIQAINQCLQQVNRELQQFAHQQYEHHIVGSTVVVFVCESNRCAVLWAGDSRLYRLRNHSLAQLTQDHCTTKNTNIITRAVGATDVLELDCKHINVMQGDLFLLCSDGLDKEISFAEIEHIMKTCTPENIANTLITKTLECGARDNVSVVVIKRVL